MKLKIAFFCLFVLISTVTLAQATVNVFINGTMAGQILLKQNQKYGGLSYKKADYKKIDRLVIEIKGRSVDGGYLRKLEVIGDAITPMLVVSETPGAVGQFVLTDKLVIRRLTGGKPITMYIEKTPANTKSKEAVSKVYLGTLTSEK